MKKALLLGMAAAFAMIGAAKADPVDLSTYADKDGYILVKKLTCAQLANTYQEDANFLGVWYSGWYNGLGKKSALNVPRVKEGIHQTIVYCQAHPEKTIIEAIGILIKQEKAMSTK
ncbi:MAG: HdeA/HdeB family chaperone [Clostridia bacterium]|nr:HdeA/HdeB family chaperone [Clostridia bacterium]